MAEMPTQPQVEADGLDPALIAAMESLESGRMPRTDHNPTAEAEETAEPEGVSTSPTAEKTSEEPAKVEPPPKPGPTEDDDKASIAADPQSSRGQLALARQEERIRAKLAAEQKAFEERVKAAEPQLARLAEIERDPILKLAAAGDWEAVARIGYQRALGDKAPPELRAAAKEHETRSELQQLRDLVSEQAKSLAEFRQSIVEERSQEAWRTSVRADIGKLADDAAPAVKCLAESRPEIAMKDLETIRRALRDETGLEPTTSEIVTTYEKRLADILPPDFLEYLKSKKKQQPTIAARAADTKETAATNTLTQRGTASPNKPRPQPQFQDRTSEMLAELEALDRAKG